MESERRCRLVYSPVEKQILFELTKKYRSILEDKTSNAETSAARKKCWLTIQREFNKFSFVTTRTPKQLMKWWDNTKNKQRREMKPVIKVGKDENNSPELFQMDWSSSSAPMEDHFKTDLDAQQPSSSGKEAGLISYTNPGPSTSQENLLVESEDLIFVKEEPYVSDNEQEHYETAFVDFSATESYRHDELSGSSYGGAPIPETYYGVETESNVEPSDAQQSGHVIEKAVSLAAGQAHDSKRSSTQRSTQQDNARSCDEKEQDKTSSPTEASGNYTKSRFRVMELTLEQLKKEHKAKMKEHEANMREHEKRMSDQEKITEMQLDIMKKEHEMKITEIEFRYQDLKKKSDWDSKVHKLTIMNLQQKLSTCQLEHQEKSKLHELVVQELQQKLTNSQLEHRILLKKLKELGE